MIFNFGQRSNYGYQPWSGVVLDNYGNLYGNTEQGGQHGFGTVYELLRTDIGRSYITLYSFPFNDPAEAPSPPSCAIQRDICSEPGFPRFTN